MINLSFVPNISTKGIKALIFPSLIRYGEDYSVKREKYGYQILHKFEGKSLAEYALDNYFYDRIYKRFKYGELFKIFFELSRIIQDLHQRGFSHNNLNMDHILYNEENNNICTSRINFLKIPR